MSCNVDEPLDFDSGSSSRLDAITAIGHALLEDGERPSSSAMSSSLVAIAGSACFGLWMTVHFVPPKDLFAWHPLLMGAAIGSCGASSALGVRVRAMAPGRARLATLWSHLWLNAFGCVLVIVLAIITQMFDNFLGNSSSIQE